MSNLQQKIGVAIYPKITKNAIQISNLGARKNLGVSKAEGGKNKLVESRYDL